MEKTIIEVNGVKLEVDLRTARRIDTLQIGSRVKVLVKESYGTKHTVYPGTVVGFEPFNQLPTVIVAYISREYGKYEIKFCYYNAQTEGVEIVASVDDDILAIEKQNIVAEFAREIAKHRGEIEELEAKRDYFLDNFGAYFGEVAKVDPGQVA